MKKLLLLTKTLLAVALLCVGQNAWATDVPYTIGSEGCGYRAEYSDPYTVKNGETLHITFTNNNFGTGTVWYNYILEATSAVDKHDGVYFDLRGDNYAFDQGTFVQNYNGNCTSDLNGATVDNYITYAGGVITVNQIFTKAEVTTYNRVYTYTVAGSPASVIIYVTEEAAQVTITNVETSKWSTVWTTDFSSAPSGMTYSVSNGSTSITNGYLVLAQGGSADRTMNIAFTDTKFNVDTDWIMEFDWSCGLSNQNTSTGTFATDQGTAFVVSWGNNGTTATIKDAAENTLTSILPPSGYNTSTMSKRARFTVKGVKGDGIYLTVSQEGTTYVNNVKVTSTFGYPKTFNGTVARAVSRMFLDNIVFRTPAVAGFVATPTSEITGAAGTSRKFTLDCLTEGTTIYWATSDLEKGAAGWNTYSSEVTTASATIYAYAKDESDNTSEKINFSTGAGSAITLNAPTVTVSNMIANGSYYNVRLDAWYNTAGVEFTPSATLTATFTPEGGSASDVDLPYTVTQKGTLTITASAAGFTSANTEVPVAALYGQSWQSLDFSSLVGIDAVQDALDTDWSQQDGHGRWASWTDQSYNFYQHGSAGTGNITVNDKLRMREVVLIAEGRGLGRNITGNEAISVISSTGDIVGFEVYNGYGATINKGVNTYKSYGINLGGNPSVNTNNGALLVQATIFSAVPASVSATIGATGWATFSSDYALDFSKATEGLEAYMITGHDGTVVTKSQVTGTVPAGTGLLLKGDEGNYTIPVVASSSTDVSANKLVAGTGASVSKEDNMTKYVLGVNGENAEFQKIDGTAATVPTGKAYLVFNGEILARTMSFVGDITGVETVEAVSEAKAKEGKFIENGKLVIVKNGQKFNAAGAKLY